MVKICCCLPTTQSCAERDWGISVKPAVYMFSVKYVSTIMKQTDGHKCRISGFFKTNVADISTVSAILRSVRQANS